MQSRSDLSARAILLALGLSLGAVVPVMSWLAGPAWAQDDDDDDGDDDDDDDEDSDDGGVGSSDNGGNGGSGGPPVVVRRSVPAPVAVVPRPEQADDQIVVGTLDEAAADLLTAEGFSVLAEGTNHVLLGLPDDLDVAAALALMATELPGVLAAPNSYYRSQAVPTACEADICGHWGAVGWPPTEAPEGVCRFEPHIGVVDTGVNVDHAMLSRASVTVETIGSVPGEPSERKHGTAVVAMFVGDPDDRVPGLVPAARLVVMDPFGRVDGDERSDVFALVEALDRLGAAGVEVASLSLAGPDNPFLAEAVARLQQAGIPVVAAVGNAGARAEPMFPAAYADVVAVTAVDRRQAIYRRAVQGEHVSFAAPGVEISTAASISGVRPQTGTSFAVPFVTTALAAAMAGGAPASEAIAALAAGSVDLGEPGRDPVFGWGLIQIPSPC